MKEKIDIIRLISDQKAVVFGEEKTVSELLTTRLANQNENG